jgi:F0F1-type ATP synthase membrane subunit b/b'
MTNDKIKQTLDELGRQLTDVENLDPEVIQRLASMVAEVQSKLDDEQGEQEDHQTIAERLREATIQFEESHPTLASTVERLIDTLGQMGI